MKILIIRTIQAELIDGLIDKWREKFPDATFDVLTHNGQPNISKKVNVTHLYEVQADFSWKKLNKLSRKSLKGYDVIIFPHKWESITGFHEVIELAIRLNPKQIYHSSKDGELVEVRKRMLLWVWLRKTIVLSGFLILIPLLVLLYLKESKWKKN